MEAHSEILTGKKIEVQNQSNLPIEFQNTNPLVIWSPFVSALVAIIAVSSQLISIVLTRRAQNQTINIQKRELKTQKDSLGIDKVTLENQYKSLELQQANLEKTIDTQKENLAIQRDAIKNSSLLEFSKRYDYIYFDLRQKVKKDEQYPIEDYYIRFWSLQQDEYISWLQGFLDDNAYKMFLKARKQEYLNKAVIIQGKLGYKEGFDLAQKELAGQTNKFFSFIYRVFTEKIDDIDNIMTKEKLEYKERNNK